MTKTNEDFVIFDDKKSIKEFHDVNLLLALQMILPGADSKDIVDRPTNKPIQDIIEDLNGIQDELNLVNIVKEILSLEKFGKYAIGKDDQLSKSIELIKNNIREKNAGRIKLLEDFVDRNFYPVGYDIAIAIPPDYKTNPEFLNNIKNVKLLEMAKALNNIWKNLSRQKVKIGNSGISTLLELPHSFIIPGGRFREFYYWDTYWILEGLLVSEMNTTARNIIANFISIINKYGYIPNGTRTYYLHRSQPPYFTMMLFKLLDIEDGKYNDLVLGDGLDAALKEYKFWDKYRKIQLEDKNGKKHFLNYYNVQTNYPRPESNIEDFITYAKQEKRIADDIYSNIKSAAESGWDFSSRWFKNPEKIETIRITEQIPVDLNAILYRNEVILQNLLNRAKKTGLANQFSDLSEKRKEAMNAILWNSDVGCWNDYLYKQDKFVDDKFYFSNIMPLIYGVPLPNVRNSKWDILRRYQKELFGYAGGVPASGEGEVESAQQWDFPNVWAPHPHMLVEYLLRNKEDEMAFHCAISFFNSVYEGFRRANTFYEKYNCKKLGITGDGGEYEPQTGFGWTNGTILSFINHFGDKLMEKYDFDAKVKEISKILDRKVENFDFDHNTFINTLSVPTAGNSLRF